MHLIMRQFQHVHSEYVVAYLVRQDLSPLRSCSSKVSRGSNTLHLLMQSCVDHLRWCYSLHLLRSSRCMQLQEDCSSFNIVSCHCNSIQLLYLIGWRFFCTRLFLHCLLFYIYFNFMLLIQLYLHCIQLRACHMFQPHLLKATKSLGCHGMGHTAAWSVAGTVFWRVSWEQLAVIPSFPSSHGINGQKKEKHR